MNKENLIPSSTEIVEEAEKENPKADLNKIHSKTFELIKKYRHEYYKKKVEDLLSREDLVNIPKEIREKIEKELIKPIRVGEIEYKHSSSLLSVSYFLL